MMMSCTISAFLRVIQFLKLWDVVMLAILAIVYNQLISKHCHNITTRRFKEIWVYLNYWKWGFLRTSLYIKPTKWHDALPVSTTGLARGILLLRIQLILSKKHFAPWTLGRFAFCSLNKKKLQGETWTH